MSRSHPKHRLSVKDIDTLPRIYEKTVGLKRFRQSRKGATA